MGQFCAHLKYTENMLLNYLIYGLILDVIIMKHELCYITEEYPAGYAVYLYSCKFCEKIFTVDSRYMRGLDILKNNTLCQGKDVFIIKI